MYSRRKVEKKIELLEVKGTKLVYHSVEACDQAAGHLEEIRKRTERDEGPEAVPQYDQEESRWIANERALCSLDYLYFATRYGYILAEEEMIHYRPNVAQLIANDARAELEDLGWSVLMMFLKARQVGITTDAQMCMAQKTMSQPHTVALTGSSDKDRSSEMVVKYRAIYDQLPPWLRPKITANRTGTRMAFDELNSRLIVQHGAQKFDIGRGNTPTAFHLSECASYLNAEDLIDAGLMPAIHDSPRILGILESTGEGPYGWWYDTWEHCKKTYWKGGGRFRPIFLPWFVAKDFCPTPTWLLQHKVPEGWRPDGVVRGHAERAAKFVRASDLLRRYYPENWRMPIEQMWFWWVNREEYRAKKRLDRFMHEYAADDLEAFAPSGDSVFDIDTLSVYGTNCREPVGVYGFRAHASLIPGRLQADETDRDTTRAILDVGPYQLVPVRWEGWQTSNPLGKLLIFQWPERGEEYGFGVDTGDGIGQDNTVLEGYRKGTPFRVGEQICELACNYVNANDFAPMCHCVGLFYQGPQGRQPKMVIETGLNGESTQLEMKKLGWSNFHMWVRYDRKRIDQAGATRMGFVTNRWSRPMVIDYLVKALRDGDLEINSPEFVKEMQALHRDEGMQAARAEYGKHDDRFMALGIVFLSMHILELSGRAASLSAMRHKRGEVESAMYRDTLVGDQTVTLDDGGTMASWRRQTGSGAANRALNDFFGNAGTHPGSYLESGGEL